MVVCGGHREVFCQTRVTDSSPLIPEVYVEIYLDKTSRISHRQVSKKSNRRDLRMIFNQLVDEPFAQASERYHGLMTDLPTASMEDWEFTKGFYCRLSQEANEHIDTLLEEHSLCSTLKKYVLSSRSFLLAKGRVRSMV
jgi:hypothetical protein